MKICVIGSGYVGLVTGTCFAESGNDVICVDIDEDKIRNLKKGKIPIYEPGLEELVLRNLEEKRLYFTTDLEVGVKNSDIIFIAVGTPSNEDGSADTKHVFEVAKNIAQFMNEYKIIVGKSTIPVGTMDKVEEIIKGITKYPFDIVFNPEFLKEGAAIEDFMKPDRVVIGVRDENGKVAQTMKELYAPFVRTEKPIIVMDIRSAELSKYAANAFLATKVSFINEIANLCEKVGADVFQVRKGMGSDSRIGYQFLFPGVGFGGSCFPKDIRAIEKIATDYDYDFKIVKAVTQVNELQKKVIVKKIYNYFNGNLKDKNIAVWGLSFKPRTDDMREAPSIEIINNLLNYGCNITAYDPEAMKEAKKVFNDSIKFAEISYDALKDADALVIITEWNEFRSPNFERIKQLMREYVIFDGRNIYNPVEVRKLGFKYFGIGRL